jgi:fucose permease
LTATFRRDRQTWLAYLFLCVYSFFINGFGPITPFLKDELRLSYTVSSLHFSAFAAGMLLIGLSGNWVIGRTGRWPAAWIGAFGLSAGTVALLAGRSPVVTVGAAFVIGLVGTLILVVVPAALSEGHGELRAAALAEANVFSSCVAMAAPLLVGLSARLTGSWRAAFAVAACAPLVMRLLVPPAPAGAGTAAKAGTGAARATPARQPLPARYWVYWAAQVLAVSVEFCMIYWSADYLEKHVGLAKVDAAQAVSLFLGGMIVGRFAGSRLVQRNPTARVVLASTLLAGAGFALFWAAGRPLPVLVGLFVAGLGVASLYPLILSLAIAAAGSATDQASARGTLASGTAILVLPLVLGRLADLAGIRPAYGLVAVLLAGVFLIVLVANHATRGNEQNHAGR